MQQMIVHRTFKEQFKYTPRFRKVAESVYRTKADIEDLKKMQIRFLEMENMLLG